MVADSKPEIRRQFSLRQLFLATTVAAVAAGLYVWVGVSALLLTITAGLVAFGLFSWVAGTKNPVLTRLAEFGVLIVLLAIIAISVIPSGWFEPNRSNNRGQCSMQLKQIALALHLYHSDHGSYPPIATNSLSGRPMHSWRTLILPMVERQDLFSRVDLNEPWDGPTNSLLHGANIKVFRCPSDRGAATGTTSYLAVIMPNAEPSQPFAVIELPNAKINYLEPRDVTLQELDILAAKSPQGGSHNSRQTAVHIAWPEGTVDLIELSEVPAQLRERMETVRTDPK